MSLLLTVIWARIKIKKCGGGGEGAMDQHYVATIKVLGGLVIPKECRQWHTHTKLQTYIVIYRLNCRLDQFMEKLLYNIHELLLLNVSAHLSDEGQT